MADLGSLVIRLEAQTAGFRSAMANAERALGDVQRAGRDLDRSLGSLKTGFAALAGVLGGLSLGNLAAESIRGTAEIKNLSAALNVSTETLSTWEFAARATNIEAGKVADIFKDVQDKIGDFARTGGGEAADIFEQLNLQIEDFIGLSADQQLLKLGQAISQLGSQSEKIFFLESLADDASRLLPLLEDNAQGFQTLAREAAAAGAIISGEQAAAAAAAQVELTKLASAWDAAIRAFTATPAAVSAVGALSEGVAALARHSDVVAGSIAALATVLSGRLLASLAGTAQAYAANLLAARAQAAAVAQDAASTVAATGAKAAFATMLLREAEAAVAAATGMARLTAVQTTLIPAQARATAAAAAHAAALQAQAAAAANATLAARTLSGALAFFGGPLGLAITALAAGFFILSTRTEESATAADIARDANAQLQAVLGQAPATLDAVIAKTIQDTEEKLRNAEAALAAAEANRALLQSQVSSPLNFGQGQTAQINAGIQQRGEDIVKAQAEIAKLQESLTQARNKLKQLGEQVPASFGAIPPAAAAGAGAIKKMGETAAQAADKARDAIRGLVGGLEEFETIAAGGRLGQLTLARNIASTADEYRGLVRSVEDAVKALEDEARIAGIVDEAEQRAARSALELAKGFEAIGASLPEGTAERLLEMERALERVQERTAITREVIDRFTVSSREFATAWIDALDEVGDFLAEGLVSGFDDAAETISATFKSLLADLIRQAVINPILLQVGLATTPGAGTPPGTPGGIGGAPFNFGGFNAPGGLFGKEGVTLPGGLGGGTYTSTFATNPFLGGAGAFGGTLAANALFPNTTGIGASLGAVAGSFIPIPGVGQFVGAIAGAAIESFVTGLFKDKERIRLGTAQALDDAAVRATSRDVLQQGPFGFVGLAESKGVSSRDFEGFLQGIVEIDKVLAASLLPAQVDAIAKALDGFVSSSQTAEFDLEHLTRERIGFILGIVEASAEFPELLRRSIGPLQETVRAAGGDVGALVAQFVALQAVSAFADTDFGQVLAGQIEAANRTLLDVFDAQSAAMLDLALSAQIGTQSFIDLAAGAQTFTATVLQVLAQVQAVEDEAGALFQSTVRDITLAQLDQQGQYLFFLDEAEAAFAALQTALEPEEVLRLARALDTAVQAAFRTLPDTESERLGNTFIRLIEEADTIVKERLNEVRDRVDEEAAVIQRAIEQGLTNAANAMQAAANTQAGAAETQLAAAQTPLNVQVNVNLQGSEVGA